MKNKGMKFFLIIVITIMLTSLSGCTGCARYEWQQVYDAYTQENERFVYQSINASIKDLDALINEKTSSFKLIIDAEDYLDRYKEDPKADVTLAEYRRHAFYFVDESIVILEETGFFNDINEDTKITFTVNNYIGWDGWTYPIFSVKIGEKIYLDFEPGRENILNYIRGKL